MSRSNPESSVSNPIKKIVSFNSKKKTLQIYDKTTKEKSAVESIEFILLDDQASITGYDMDKELGYVSNYIKPFDGKTEKFQVYGFSNKQKKLLENDIWGNIKFSSSIKGAKYTLNLFSLIKIKGKWEISNIQLKNTSIPKWNEFKNNNENNIYNYSIHISGGDMYFRKGKESVKFSKKEQEEFITKITKDPFGNHPAWWYAPSIKLGVKLNDKEIKMAKQEDILIQEYLTAYRNKDSQQESSKTEPQPTREEEPKDDLPF